MRALIVNADDLGYDPAIDRGLLLAAERGILTSASLMVTTPFASAAAQAARARTRLGLGLHVNLNHGAPLTRSRALMGSNGGFDVERALHAPPEEIAAEIEAQLARFQALVGLSPTHLDVHKHYHRMPAVFEAVAQVAANRKLPVRALDPPMRDALRNRAINTPDAFLGDTGQVPWWTASRLLSALDALGPGVTEVMCHPGFTPEQVRSGYASQREAELEALCDPAVVARAHRGDIVLADYRALAPRS